MMWTVLDDVVTITALSVLVVLVVLLIWSWEARASVGARICRRCSVAVVGVVSAAVCRLGGVTCYAGHMASCRGADT